MTPAATTPAARKASPQRRRGRQSARPTAPRRVSGPVGGRASTAAATAASATTVPGVALPRRSATRPRRPHRPRTAGARLRIGAFIRSLPDHKLLDRLIRGRWWIPVLGVMLAGIVAMQVEVLKLGASMGRSLERNSVLSAENAGLRQSVATLGDDQRIEQLAGTMGMVMPPPQAVGFLSASPSGNAGRALANIHQPSATSFLALTPTNGEIVTSATLAAANAASAASSTTGSTSTIGTTPTSSTTTPTSTSGSTTSAVAAAPTVSSSDSSSTAATPTAVNPSPTSSSGTTSSSQAATSSQTSTGSSTGAVGIAPPSTTTGG